MKKFLCKLGKTILFLWLILLILHLLLIGVSQWKVVRPNNDWAFLKEVDVSTLWIGNSRTWVHVNPKYLNERFGENSYVLATDGQSLSVNYLKFKHYYQNKQNLKTINLQFDLDHLKPRKDFYNSKTFSPFLLFNFEAYKVLKDYDGNKWYYYIMPFCAFSTEMITELIFKPNYSENLNGFECKDKHWESKELTKSMIEKYPNEFTPCPELDSLFMFSKKNDIIINGYIPPYQKELCDNINFTYLEKLFAFNKRKYSTKGELYDFNGNQLSSKNLFYNYNHLNCDGSAIFNEMLGIMFSKTH